MKASYNWIKQYLKLDHSPEAIAEILTDTGLEVEGLDQVESVQGGLRGVVFGKVKSCIQHPNADKLKLTKVDVGEAELLDIVCGAPNVAEGQTVLVAKVGATLYPNGEELKIKKAKIRGEASQGMLCAEDELGLGTSHDGIFIVQDEVTIGAPIAEYFGIESDEVFEIGLTPNRTDAMGHFGVARDIYAFLRRKGQQIELSQPSIPEIKSEVGPVEVVIENTEACPRYLGLSLKHVKVGPSPDWLKNRLKAIGQKPINNVVDVTNFVMHELGQPLHAFDRKAIKGNEVRVKTLSKDSVFITLDGEERKLREEDLMICNGNNEGMCIAGVFGGEKSGVTESTTDVFLESAYFNPVWVRKTAKHHGLNTDASFRFERGVDPNACDLALKRAAALIMELAEAELDGGIQDVYPEPILPTTVELSLDRLNVLAGQDLEEGVVRTILDALDIKILSETGRTLSLQIPTYRTDVLRPADVMEEVLRIYGYNEIRLTGRISAALEQSNAFDPERIQDRVADLLASNGFNECMSNSLTSVNYHSEVFPEERSVKMKNPLSQDLAVMRQTLAFSGLEAISRNQKRKRPDLKLFEFGKTYQKLDSGFNETPFLSLFISGNLFGESWINQGEGESFYFGKSMLGRILDRLGVSRFKIQSTSNPVLRDGLDYKLGKQSLASLGWMDSEMLKKADVSGDVMYVELNWNLALQLAKDQKMRYETISKFPPVRRDLALLLDKSIEFDALERTARNAERKLLTEVDLFDVYEGKNLPEGKKSYALSFILEDPNKTLSDKLIDKAMGRIQAALEKEHGAQLRA